jgi:hypothetical protein
MRIRLRDKCRGKEVNRFHYGEPGAPDGVADEPKGVGDGDLLTGVQKLLFFQVKILQSKGSS